MVTYRCSRFVLPLPDRNRDVPVRNIPFPISRNTGFVFPSGLPVPVSVPGKKIQEREWLRHFPDRSRPFSSLASGSLDVVLDIWIVFLDQKPFSHLGGWMDGIMEI